VNGPLRFRRLGLGLVVAGAVLAGLSRGIRADRGTDQANWTYVLDVVAVLLAVAGAIFEARTADLLFNFAPRAARRHAFLRLVGGVLVGLLACVLLSFVDQPVVHSLAAGVILLGVGIGAGGLFSLVWYYGGGYAADRIQERSKEDW
jgi:drug/metabolite transporter (DMT)-like permease